MARHLSSIAILLFGLLALPSPSQAQAQMPNPKEMSGSILPSADLPAGTVSVRLIRGSFSNNIVDWPVEFSIDGARREVKTDASGRAQVSGLKRGTRVIAVAVVDGERLESKEAVVGDSGLRVILVATDPEMERRAAEDRKLAASPPVAGMVVLGPESRVVAELGEDGLNVFYVLEVLNNARTPIDIGGPLIIDLPRGARGAGLLDGSSKQATVAGARVTITGPFQPGSTPVHVGYGLDYRGATARVAQTLPAAMQQLNVLVQQTGGIQVRSEQLASVQEVEDQGRRLILGRGPGVPAGQRFVLEISGLPHHPSWPRYTALAMAAAIVTVGLWAAFVRPRPAHAT